jgi:hypothetical protein
MSLLWAARVFDRLMQMTPGEFRRNFRALNEAKKTLLSYKKSGGSGRRIAESADFARLDKVLSTRGIP